MVIEEKKTATEKLDLRHTMDLREKSGGGGLISFLVIVNNTCTYVSVYIELSHVA